MELNSEVMFADENLKEVYLKLTGGKFEEKQLKEMKLL
jgi:hypothetical protein